MPVIAALDSRFRGMTFTFLHLHQFTEASQARADAVRHEDSALVASFP